MRALTAMANGLLSLFRHLNHLASQHLPEDEEAYCQLPKQSRVTAQA